MKKKETDLEKKYKEKAIKSMTAALCKDIKLTDNRDKSYNQKLIQKEVTKMLRQFLKY